MMHLPVSEFPLFSKKNSDSAKNFHNFTFSRKNFFIHRPQNLNFPLCFRISPLFSLLQYIPPCFAKIIISSYFLKFPPFPKIHVYFTYFTCISLPPTLTMMHLCITHCTYGRPCMSGQSPSAITGTCNICTVPPVKMHEETDLSTIKYVFN